MSAGMAHEAEYVVPTYRAPAGTSWYHFLYGNVPDHQLDFIYRPEVPQGLLTPQHFSHLIRLIKYIEPRGGSRFAFAVANLSRDDTQHEPGHGGVALIFGLRVRGAKDHAGRRDPPFAHALVAVDRGLDSTTLQRAAVHFFGHLFGEREGDESGAVRGMYTKYIADAPAARTDRLQSYVEAMNDLPSLERSALSLKWVSRGAVTAKRVSIVHADDAPFDALARCATRIAVTLYQSDLRWTSITTGREAEIPNGVSVRLVPRRDAQESSLEGLVVPIEQVPEDEAELAAQLFGLSAFERQVDDGAKTDAVTLVRGAPLVVADAPPAGFLGEVEERVRSGDVPPEHRHRRGSLWIGVGAIFAIGLTAALVCVVSFRRTETDALAAADGSAGAIAVTAPASNELRGAVLPPTTSPGVANRGVGMGVANARGAPPKSGGSGVAGTKGSKSGGTSTKKTPRGELIGGDRLKQP